MAETAEADRVEAGNPGLRRVVAAPAPLPLPAPGKRRTGLAGSFAAALEERRLFVLLPFAMIGGLITAVQVPHVPEPWVLMAVGGVVVASIALSFRNLTVLRLAVLAAAFWAGFALLSVHAALFGTEMLGRPAFGHYQARVDEILSETPGEKRVILSTITPLEGARALPVRRARVVIEQGPDLSPGDVVSGSFRFAPVPGPVYPGGFDTQFHAFFDGIGAYGNSTQPPVIVTTGSETAPEHVIDATRRGIAARIDAALPQPSAGIARAIINGDQSAVTDEARETMATAGIAHVLSVSGLHLTIVAGGVFAALRLLLATFGAVASRLPVKRLAAVAGLLAAVGYFAISGGNVAAFRSTLMIVLVFGAVIFGRRALTMRNVSIAAIIVIATDPASVFRPSFQLSFAAAAALVGAYENFRSSGDKDRGWFGKFWAYFAGITVTSLVAGAATLVFSVYHFQQTSPLGVLGNLASLPLVGFVMMPAAVLAVIAMPFGAEGPFLAAMGWSIDRMLDLAAVVAAWSEHLRASPLLSPGALLLALAALAWFSFFNTRWRLLAPVLLIPLVPLVALDHPPDVLIADTTQATVIRGPNGLELADGKPASFALDVWRETYAEPIDMAAAMGCDSIACIGESSAGFTYAIIEDYAAFGEECGRADLIITRMNAPAFCRAAAVIDAEDLRGGGVQWLRWDAAAHAFEIRPAIPPLERPWRIATP